MDHTHAFMICIHTLPDEMLNLHRGQGLDIHWRDHQICPTEDEYKSMVIDKTGGLFRLAIRLMQAYSNDKRYAG
jgi:geranylgeranyl diphosphate synthase type 3